MNFYAIIFAFTIFMNGSTFASMPGRFAKQLDIAGSDAIPYVPWLALMAYVVGVCLISRIKKPARRWLAFIAATLIGNAITVYPILILHHGSTVIVANGVISNEILASFKARYPVPVCRYSNSKNGGTLRVRNDQYSPDMAEYLNQLANKEPDKP